VADDIAAFRSAACEALQGLRATSTALSLAALEAEQAMLEQRIERFGVRAIPLEIWRVSASSVRRHSVLEADRFRELVETYRVKG